VGFIARGGGTWLLGTATIVVILAYAAQAFHHSLLGMAAGLFGVILIFLLWFFRDPQRKPAGGVLSPADGKVVRIDVVEDADVGRADRISIFMSPLDVHVNRIPFGGTILAVRHIPGKHIPAFNKDSDRNERVETLIQTPLGPMKVIQIAGAVARRIVPYLTSGKVTAGQRMGLIRLGSRCDLLIPVGIVQWNKEIGTQVHGASDSIGVIV